MAAAALVLFTIIPEQDKFAEAELSAPTADQVLQEREAPPQEGVNPAAPAKELAIEDGETKAPPGAAPAPRPNAAKKAPELKAEAGNSSYQPAPDDARRTEPDPVDETEDRTLAPRDALEDAPREAPAVADIGFQDEGMDYGEGSFEDDADYEDMEVQAVESRTRAPTRGGSGGGLFGGRADNTSAPSAPVQESAKSSSVMADADDFAYEEEPMEEEAIPTDLDGLRAAARPWDYNPEWYLISLQGSEMDAFAGAVDLAEARASEGDYTGAAEACRELAASSDDPRVRQDMYGRASYFSMSLNDARTGQKVSSANTPFLARLYWAEGRALENSGDIEGARRAYTTAANLNAAR